MVPSKSVAARAEKRETDTCAAWILPIHTKHLFSHLMIWILMVSSWSVFWFGMRSYPYHITRLDPYFLHLASVHFVPVACAHCDCPGGGSNLYSSHRKTRQPIPFLQPNVVTNHSRLPQKDTVKSGKLILNLDLLVFLASYLALPFALFCNIKPSKNLQ